MAAANKRSICRVAHHAGARTLKTKQQQQHGSISSNSNDMAAANKRPATAALTVQVHPHWELRGAVVAGWQVDVRVAALACAAGMRKAHTDSAAAQHW